ncbi:hypothetical protein G6O69_14420 [Pseudenhygromyxa sp. WMMC2535]|uniref:hypothetical protein n=1 Tax=Pseudenhygromyxa sp. WMMC2535 TaxID=2712867 RepID=UPI001555299F|nr:hypothetical protein [Pseudenhygromyxa sp. WMMC2535]NVB39034.1 hypothetical protein [Pseudenhygromyxa sp. WMMC2535]
MATPRALALSFVVLSALAVAGCRAPDPSSTETKEPSEASEQSEPSIMAQVCAVFDAHAGDRSLTLDERREAIVSALDEDAIELLEEVSEDATRWEDVEAELAARGYGDEPCPSLEAHMTMILAGEDDTEPGATARLTAQVDALCSLAAEVGEDAEVEASARVRVWMQRAAEAVESGPVRQTLEAAARAGELDAALLEASLADHAAPGWTCPALAGLFTDEGAN